MLNIAICLDRWKLKIFRKTFDEAGYEYKIHKGPGDEVMTLSIKAKTAKEIVPIVEKANDTAARSKMN